MKRFLPLAVLLALPACSIFEGDGDEIVFDTALGPRTESQIETLPGTLEGDHDSARYSSEPLKGENMESVDGSLE